MPMESIKSAMSMPMFNKWKTRFLSNMRTSSCWAQLGRSLRLRLAANALPRRLGRVASCAATRGRKRQATRNMATQCDALSRLQPIHSAAQRIADEMMRGWMVAKSRRCFLLTPRLARVERSQNLKHPTDCCFDIQDSIEQRLK